MSKSGFQYQTFASKCEGLYKEKESKFIAYGFTIRDEEDFMKHLGEIKKEHQKARHYCYAYLLGYEGENTRLNDDGEPGNTAGKPILGQMIKAHLSFSAIVVVRYFGGTKLGVGGLIKAYKSAAESCIEKADLKPVFQTCVYQITHPYNASKKITRELGNIRHTIISQKFDITCELTIEIKKTDQSKIEDCFKMDAEILLVLLEDHLK